MAFPVEEGLKLCGAGISSPRKYSFYGLSSRRRIETSIRTLRRHECEGFYGLSSRRRIETVKCLLSNLYDRFVFMAFPVEEGLKRETLGEVCCGLPCFYGLSSRRRIETVNQKSHRCRILFVFMAFPVEEGLKPTKNDLARQRDNVFMAFPVEEGLKLGYQSPRHSPSVSVFMAFPVEEGLKQQHDNVELESSLVFMAFPVEEGLKLFFAAPMLAQRFCFYGLSSRRRIETRRVGFFCLLQHSFYGLSSRRRIET